MSRASKRNFAEFATSGTTEYPADGHAYRPIFEEAATRDAPPAAGASAAVEPSAIAAPAYSSEASSGSGLIPDKSEPFALPCITDDKLLLLMAQDSVNGRL